MVFLINSPLFRETMDYDNEDSLPPIGLGLIATHLQNNHIPVNLFDAIFHKTSIEELKSILNLTKPEFIGINIFTTNYELVKELIEAIGFSTHILIGGLSTKALYVQIIEWTTPNQIDVIIGDGELITLDVVKNKVKEEPILVRSNRRVFIINSNSQYFLSDISDTPLTREFFINDPTINNSGQWEANIITGRGCTHNCTFCAAARSLNLDYHVRERSESSIIKELKEIQIKHPEIVSVRILDDLFLKSRTSIIKAISIFSKFDFQWRSMAHISTFNKVEQSDLIDLKKCGCNELFIGIESGSTRILKAIKKTYDKDLILTNLIKIFKSGIKVKGYFIFGFPGETLDDMKSTYRLATEIKQISLEYQSNFRVSVFQFRLYHGSELYNTLSRMSNFRADQIKPNQTLTNLIGRNQFNFQSGNFSKVGLGTIHKYICRTNNLNGSRSYTKGTQAIN